MGAEALSRVPGHANKCWFNVCKALAEGLCVCVVGGGETEGFSEVEGRVEVCGTNVP